MRGFGLISHAVVVAVGLLGMFAAVVGAMIGQRLPETVDESDGFEFWASDSDDECGLALGNQRESTYGPLRVCECV